MQEEIENKVTNLAISTTKLTVRTLYNALKALVNSHKRKSAQKSMEQARENSVPARIIGKQTVKELIGQNQGVTSIDIAKTDIKGFEKYARKYGVDYAITKDKSVNPPNYMVFFKARDSSALEAALKAYTSEALRKKEKPSVKEQISNAKELMGGLRDKIKDKTHKEPSR